MAWFSNGQANRARRGGLSAVAACLAAGCGSGSGGSASLSYVTISGASLLSSGAYHSCALDSGAPRCWGSNEYGQTGASPAVARVKLPVRVELASATALATGEFHSCAISGGKVFCWGWNSAGQLGTGGFTDSVAPVEVSGLSGATALAAGRAHTCALMEGGTARCWGSNAMGQLGSTSVGSFATRNCGDGTTACFATDPKVVEADLGGTALASVTAIVAGENHSCALQSDGGVVCWGDQLRGQTGTGTQETQGVTRVPTRVSGLASGVSAIGAGRSHACAALAAGGARCWGSNSRGQLGSGAREERATTPVAVSGLSEKVTAWALGERQSCALLADGTAKCWGEPSSGRLGINYEVARETDTYAPTSPVSLGDNSALAGITGISAGRDHACATTAKAIYCWGRNSEGQFGDGTLTGNLRAAVAIEFP